MNKQEQWLQWAIELQSLAQAGLTYGKDVYDKERYERIRDISAEMISNTAEIPLQKVKGLFCNETGYQTPKLDTRAAIFENGKILLVRENNGKWSLPGGWCDVNVSIGENAVKEVKEESGLDVVAESIIAIQDRAKHNLPVYAYGVCKVFVLCSVVGGGFIEKSVENVLLFPYGLVGKIHDACGYGAHFGVEIYCHGDGAYLLGKGFLKLGYVTLHLYKFAAFAPFFDDTEKAFECR